MTGDPTQLSLATLDSSMEHTAKPAVAADPADIEVSRQRREMRIRWQNGHESVYSFDLLRKQCPCALCAE